MKKLIVGKVLILILLVSDAGLVSGSALVFGQNSVQNPGQPDQVSVGIGAGLDYGGFGGNLIYYPLKRAGVFAGAGYALAGAGFNAGIKYRIIPAKPEARIHPFAVAMYGYNAAIAVYNATDLNRLFYGPTFGVGIDIHSSKGRRGYWSVALLVPVRNAEVHDYMEELENDYGADFQNSLFPVAASFGYRFVIK